MVPEIGIRTTTTLNKEISNKLEDLQSDIRRQKWYRRLFAKKYRRRVIRYSLLASNVVLLVLVVAFVAQKPEASAPVMPSLLTTKASEENIVDPLDELSSADIAVNVARSARLEEATSVTNKADTVNAQLSITPSDDVISSKPQIVATGLKSRKDIKTYVAQEGDTVTSIAEKFGITSDTIRWSNSLTGDSVTPGKELVISPINGVVYKVGETDTLDSIIAKYGGNKEQIIVFNDIEVGGLPVGQYIVIPDGKPQARGSTTAASIASSANFAWGGYSPVYGGNGYDYGYCTWWAAVRRAQIGRPIPSNLGNASTWKVLAQRAGLGVGNTPAAGAVIWTPPRDYYGHVGFVESVNPDGSVNISEMNTAGWGVVSRKTLSAADAARYGYIY